MLLAGSLRAAVVVLATVIVPAPAAESSQVTETRVGDTVMVKLTGNPRAGYRWQLNTAESRGLDIVEVRQIGWIMAPEGRSIFFRNESTLNVAVRGKTAGEANLAFDYYRTWGSLLKVRTTTIRVIVKPSATAQK